MMKTYIIFVLIVILDLYAFVNLLKIHGNLPVSVNHILTPDKK